jgi:HTH-type transcriptional regulator / antitoxin HigA
MAELNPARGFEPNWSTHPGEHIEEYLEENGWSQAELARRAGLTPKLVSEIINGKNPVTPETALKLERVLDLKAEVWLGLQSSWDLFHARQRETAPERKSWLAQFPVKDLKAQKLLPDTKEEGVLVKALLDLLGIADPGGFAPKLSGMAVQHRQSRKFESDAVHVGTWLLLGEQRARSMDLPEYDQKKFQAAVSEIRGTTRQAPKIFEPRMKKLCANAGVALIFVKPLGHTRLFGSTWWFDGDKRAIIQMSLRMKSNDHFWWTFFHECGHVDLHRGKNFADDQSAEGDGPEEEADRWAEEKLYGPDRQAGILANPPTTMYSVRRLADELKLHPGIIVGMLQHHGKLPYSRLNELKAKFGWSSQVRS